MPKALPSDSLSTHERRRSVLKLKDIRIRDPFILTDKEQGCYYMYGTTALEEGSTRAGSTFSVYKSYDLESFDGPKVVFDGSRSGLAADKDYWAAEVHKYRGRYYLFGSCKADGKCRGTYIFVSDTPDGDFVPLSSEPITPHGWECLDGTLVIEDGRPYMVFCHEWVQIGDGEIYALELSDDLSRPIGEPILLFRASENPDVEPIPGHPSSYVTDGPFLYREGERIVMIWSSLGQGRYLVLRAESDNVRGPWIQRESAFDFDGGHAMLFDRLDGERMIALHSPNTTGHERAVFLEYLQRK